MNKILIFSILVAFSAIIGACGVKPSTVKAPETSGKAYPAVYPNANHVE